MENSTELKYLEELIFIIMLCSKDMILVQIYLDKHKLIIHKDTNMYLFKEKIYLLLIINCKKNVQVYKWESKEKEARDSVQHLLNVNYYF